MKFLAVFLIGFLSFLPQGKLSESAAQTVRLALKVEPEQPVNGSPVLFRVWSEKPLRSLNGLWLGHRLFFEFDASSGHWCGLAGVELTTIPGKHPLKLEGVTVNGTRELSVQTVTTVAGVYASGTLTVDDQFMKPDAEAKKRIQQERALKREVFRRSADGRRWKGSFAPPVENIITEAFGVRRIFNGKHRSTHQGLDFRAALGTPVKAMNSGEVILARQMFYEGGLVVVDHGQGLLTLYLHLSEFKTKEGDQVSKGQVIGLSGATGRVTSEHLHVAVRWQGTYLDPATLLAMTLP